MRAPSSRLSAESRPNTLATQPDAGNSRLLAVIFVGLTLASAALFGLLMRMMHKALEGLTAEVFDGDTSVEEAAAKMGVVSH